jgi:O-methyltransferase involved in polyketide biosynthesis
MKVDNLKGPAETLLVPLWARAEESHQPDPILDDRRAVEIVESLQYDFDRFRQSETGHVSYCIRAYVIDQWVRRFLDSHPTGTVVDVGVGLDTRFERLDNGKVRWFDLDLPEVIEVRRQFIQDTDRRRFISKSVLDSTWLPEVRASLSSAIMFLAEGVPAYFQESQVKSLFSMLADSFPGSQLAFDSLTPYLVRYCNRRDAISQTTGRLQWGIASIRDIETWDPRYHIEESVVFAETPHLRKFYKRLPLGIRIAHLLWPPLRRNYRVNLLRFG